MKKLIKTVLGVFLLFLMLFGIAHAIPHDADGNVLTNRTGYSWDDHPYWMPTDTTTNVNGDSIFQIAVENAFYESDFGLFTVDDIQNPTSASITKFEIFDSLDSPSSPIRNVYFRDTGSVWQVSLDPTFTSGVTNFDVVFGFYYDVHTDPNSNTVNYTYFSDRNLNTVDAGDQHVAVEYDGTSNVYIVLDDQRSSFADWDWNDMTVFGNDLKPVPEPTTMVISSLFLLGAGFYVRRKLHNKS